MLNALLQTFFISFILLFFMFQAINPKQKAPIPFFYFIPIKRSFQLFIAMNVLAIEFSFNFKAND